MGAGPWTLFPLEDEVDDFRLLDKKVRDGFQLFAHFCAVESFVALGAGRPDCRAARCIEQAKLDPAGVCDFAHNAAECVDFTDQVALRNATNCRITGHLSDQVKVEREQRRSQPHARGSGSGFTTGMSGTHNEDIKTFGTGHNLRGVSLGQRGNRL